MPKAPAELKTPRALPRMREGISSPIALNAGGCKRVAEMRKKEVNKIIRGTLLVKDINTPPTADKPKLKAIILTRSIRSASKPPGIVKIA
jgi:hypothetical protein